MSLGERIFNLRKRNGFSQEQLGEKVNVTRQTISNWELGETSPNPEQLKLLSKVLSVSIDELLDNEVKDVLVEKVSNTEKLASIIIKILKFIGIAFLALIVIDIIVFILFAFTKNEYSTSIVDEVTLNCSLNNDDYLITVGSDGYFNCSNCSKELQKELKDNHIDFGDINKTINEIVSYFEQKNGVCE